MWLLTVSRGVVQGFIRVASGHLQAARQLQLLVGGAGATVPVDALASLAQAVGVAQHHDAVTGTEAQVRLTRGMDGGWVHNCSRVCASTCVRRCACVGVRCAACCVRLRAAPRQGNERRGRRGRRLRRDVDLGANARSAVPALCGCWTLSLSRCSQADGHAPPQLSTCHLVNESICDVAQSSPCFAVVMFNSLPRSRVANVRIPVMNGTTSAEVTDASTGALVASVVLLNTLPGTGVLQRECRAATGVERASAFD